MGSYKAMEKKGLIAVSMHRGEGTDAEIAWTAVSKKWTFPVYRDGNVRDFQMGSNPLIFIFDGTGKAVYSPGSAGDYIKALSSEVGKARDFVLGSYEFASLGGPAKEVEARRNLGRLLKDMTDKVAGGDETEKKEAAFISERLKKYAELTEGRAARMVEDGRPSEAMLLLQGLADQFKDSEIGTDAAAEVSKQKSDADFKAELEAEKLWKGMEIAFFKIVPPRKSEDAEKWKTKNSAGLKGLKDKFDAMKKKCGESKAFQFYSKRAAWLGME